MLHQSRFSKDSAIYDRRMLRMCVAALSLLVIAAAPRHATLPDPSSDGKRIVFNSDDSGKPQIYTMNADGSDPKLLAPSKTFDFAPDWSPDGKWIAFSAYISDDVPMQVVAINADGSNRHVVATSKEASWPRISPDGRNIAFSGVDGGGSRKIFVVNSDGTHLHQFASGLKDTSNPEWSPDGKLLLFTSRAEIGGTSKDSTTIYVADPLGNRRRQIAACRMALQMPRWSRDGTTVAFQQNLGGKEANIVLFDVAKGRFRTITRRDRPYLDETPAWLPDGRLLFQSTRDGSFEIYRMNADGTAQVRLSR